MRPGAPAGVTGGEGDTWGMSRPSSAMQVATSVLKAPARKAASTAFCSFCGMPPPFFWPPLSCPMNILQKRPLFGRQTPQELHAAAFLDIASEQALTLFGLACPEAMVLLGSACITPSGKPFALPMPSPSNLTALQEGRTGQACMGLPSDLVQA